MTFLGCFCVGLGSPRDEGRPSGPQGFAALGSRARKLHALDAGKLHLNTGSWVRMINLAVQHLGQENGLTHALIE